jgi:hypothetical protein
MLSLEDFEQLGLASERALGAFEARSGGLLMASKSQPPSGGC